METYHCLTFLHLDTFSKLRLKSFLEDLQEYHLIEKFKIENDKDVGVFDDNNYFTNQELINYFNIYNNFESDPVPDEDDMEGDEGHEEIM